ncbi:MAG: hypothetical protein QG655_14 [Actinomycetota bacterium]|jgi:type VII secretion protein EccE|nr:hypothetical protein [Actinomycetota bacterium]
MTTTSDAGTQAMVALDRAIPGAHSALPERLSRWRVNLTRRFVIVAELLAAAVLVVLSPVIWWVALLIAVAVTALITVAYNGATAAGWGMRWARLFHYRRNAAARQRRAAIPEPFNADLAGIPPVGMRWDGQYAITMIELHGRHFAPTVLVPAGADTLNTVPLEAISTLLYQFAGLELDCADVVSVSQRVADDGRYTPKYDEIVGDRPAVGVRRTWLVLRLCPQACMAAMAYRGDAAAATAAATERIRQSVIRAGCRALTCTADQMSEATAALLADRDLDLDRVDESWSHLDVNADFVTNYRIAGADLNTRLLDDIATVRSNRTVTTIRLTATRAGEVSVGAVVRFHTPAPLPHPPLLALRPVVGQAFDALLASLPLGNRALRLQMSPRRLGEEGLRIPVGPTGPILGMTVTGVPFLMPFTDALAATRMTIDADLDVVVPLLLRASAAGEVVLIHTGRPDVWLPLCDPDARISVAGPSAPHREPTLIVVDGESQDIAGGQRGHTLVFLSGSPSTKEHSDLVVTQNSYDEVTLSTPSIPAIPLTLMRPRNEGQFLSHLAVR